MDVAEERKGPDLGRPALRIFEKRDEVRRRDVVTPVAYPERLYGKPEGVFLAFVAARPDVLAGLVVRPETPRRRTAGRL